MPQTTLQLNQTKYKQLKIAAIGSGTALVLGGLAFLQPFSLSFGENANAETVTNSTSTSTTVNLEPTITVWTTDTNNNTITSTNIAADPDEDVYTSTVRAHVSTNNLTGYTLTIQSNSTDAKMIHENESIAKTIDLLTDTNNSSGISTNSWKSNSNLNNMWGYSIGSNDSFVGVPGSSSDATTIDETDAPNNDNYTDVTFAAKADLSLPAGTYTDTVIFSAVANAVPTPIVSGGYMHETTSQMCADSVEFNPEDPLNTEYELIDARTNEKYWIRKFGNLCWMVENLYIPSKQALTSADTNMEAATYTMPESSTSGFSSGMVANMYSSIRRRNSGSTGNNDGSYFTWMAAKVGVMNPTDTNNDICPKNWRLPTNAENGTITIANIGNNINNFYADGTGAAISPVLPGNYYNSSPGGTGSNAYWWSNTQYDINIAYYLYSGISSLDTGNYRKAYGSSVRCVLPAE